MSLISIRLFLKKIYGTIGYKRYYFEDDEIILINNECKDYEENKDMNQKYNDSKRNLILKMMSCKSWFLQRKK